LQGADYDLHADGDNARPHRCAVDEGDGHPPFSVLADRSQTVAIQAAADVGYGVRVGAGFGARAAIAGAVLVATNESGQVGTKVDDQLVATYAPVVGLSYDLSNDYRLGATYREKLDARFAVEIVAATPRTAPGRSPPIRGCFEVLGDQSRFGPPLPDPPGPPLPPVPPWPAFSMPRCTDAPPVAPSCPKLAAPPAPPSPPLPPTPEVTEPSRRGAVVALVARGAGPNRHRMPIPTRSRTAVPTNGGDEGLAGRPRWVYGGPAREPTGGTRRADTGEVWKERPVLQHAVWRTDPVRGVGPGVAPGARSRRLCL
jgi:hypothetical protein